MRLILILVIAKKNLTQKPFDLFLFLLYFPSFSPLLQAPRFSLCCVFLTILSSTYLLFVQSAFPLCRCELPVVTVSTTDQEDNQLENNITAGGYYSLPSAVTQICVNRQTKTCFSLEVKIDGTGKSPTIHILYFSPQQICIFFLMLLLCIWLLAAVASVAGECAEILFNWIKHYCCSNYGEGAVQRLVGYACC